MEKATVAGSQTETSDQPVRQSIPRSDAENTILQKTRAPNAHWDTVYNRRGCKRPKPTATHQLTQGRLRAHSGRAATEKNAEVSLAATWMDLEMTTPGQSDTERRIFCDITDEELDADELAKQLLLTY